METNTDYTILLSTIIIVFVFVFGELKTRYYNRKK